jgi:putative SOS response-associated peptidase YedK
MCGRFTLSAPSEDIATVFDVHQIPGVLEPRYNIAPTQMVAAVRVDPESSARELVRLRWGLVPAWAEDPAIGNKLINARGETVGSKASFKRAFKSRRCLVVADGFYEWQKAGKGKQPFHIKMKDGKPFALAGLWERWTRGDQPIESVTIVTTEPNDLVKPIHRRMPVILHPSDWDAWLDPGNEDIDALAVLLTAFPADAMVAQAVSKAVNNPKNDAPVCVEPVASGDLFL